MTNEARPEPKTIVINLFSGPGAGKSTSMAGIFHELKCLDVNCEMGHEFAKEKIWDESYAVLRDQVYVFAKQLHSLRRLEGKVEVIVTDSPIVLSLIYAKNEPPEFKAFALAVNKRFRSMNFFLHRNKKFNPSGRIHSKEESETIDEKIRNLLDESGIAYEEVPADKKSVKIIVKKIMKELEKNGKA